MLSKMKSLLRRMGFVDPVLGRDYGYRRITDEEITPELVDGWKHPDVPRKQRLLVEKQLRGLRRGRVPYTLHVAADVLQSLRLPSLTLLDVGCAGGHYVEVFEILAPTLSIEYTGVDYAEPLIALARQYYGSRGARFEVANATALPFSDDAFDVVFSSGSLIHIPDYQKAIEEQARVARGWVVFTRTPCINQSATVKAQQSAYGTRYLDLCFNESELKELFRAAGLQITQEIDLRERLSVEGLREPVELKCFVCRKPRRAQSTEEQS